MKTKYLIRLDDACPQMCHERWQMIENILDHHDVKPLVGIIPANEDPATMKGEEDAHFWEKAQCWENKGWEIALHGYNHVCVRMDACQQVLNPVWNRSEFAGVPIDKQRDKLERGYQYLVKKGVHPKYFFAPSHTYDKNTLKALSEVTPIRVISDTYTLKPYKKNGFIFIPCQLGHPKAIWIPGVYTICLHPNNMSMDKMDDLKVFLESHNHEMASFHDLCNNAVGNARLIDEIAQWAYFTHRNFKNALTRNKK